MNAHPGIPKVPALKIPCCIIIFHIKWPSYIILLHKLAPPCSTGFGETQDNSGTLEISRGCLKTPISIKWCFHALSFFVSSYRFCKCWLHTLMKQFILCFLCGISPYNHQLHICFSGKSLHLQSLLLRTCPINNI